MRNRPLPAALESFHWHLVSRASFRYRRWLRGEREYDAACTERGALGSRFDDSALGRGHEFRGLPGRKYLAGLLLPAATRAQALRCDAGIAALGIRVGQHAL